MATGTERAFNPVLLVLALGPAVGQGLGRFGYGVLLPPMRDGLGWSYTQAGFVNTANAVGYVIGALLAARILDRVDHRRAFLSGMALIAALLLVTAFVRDFAVLGVLRVLAGMAAAVVFVAGATLLTGAPGLGPRGFHLAAYYSGVGFGLLLVGLVLPPLLAHAPWHWGWIALAVLAAGALVVAARFTRSLHGASGAAAVGHARADWRRSGWLMLGYLLYGIGSIGYMTFISATFPAGDWQAVTLFWTVFFAGAAAAPFLWERVLERRAAGPAFLLITGANAVGAALPLLPLGTGGMLVSAFVFGGSFFTIVAVTTLHVARVAAPAARASTIAAFTFLFGAGQAVGPVLTGAVSDLFGSLEAGLLAGAAILAAGAGLGALQRG